MTDNTADIVKGKKKSTDLTNSEGGVRIHPSREIATIGNQKITLIARGLIEGHVIEFNEALLSNPKLLMESVLRSNYSAIIARIPDRGDAEGSSRSLETLAGPTLVIVSSVNIQRRIIFGLPPASTCSYSCIWW